MVAIAARSPERTATTNSASDRGSTIKAGLYDVANHVPVTLFSRLIGQLGGTKDKVKCSQQVRSFRNPEKSMLAAASERSAAHTVLGARSRTA